MQIQSSLVMWLYLFHIREEVMAFPWHFHAPPLRQNLSFCGSFVHVTARLPFYMQRGFAYLSDFLASCGTRLLNFPLFKKSRSLEIALTKQAKIYGKPRATIMNPRKLLDSGSPRAQNTSKYTINVCLQLISDLRLGTVFSIPRSWESWPVDCPSGSKEHWSSDPKPVDVRRVTLPMWVLWSFVKCMCNHSHLTEIPNPQKPESRIYVAKTSNAPKWNWVHPIMKLFKSNLDRALFRGHLALQTLNLAAQPHQRWAWKEDLEVPEQVSCVTKAPRAEQISWLPQ